MIPISTKQPARFTPPSLAGREDAPTFLLTIPTMRDRIAIDAAIAAEGVRYPANAELAQALRDAIGEHVVEAQWPELLAFVGELEAAAEEGNPPSAELTGRIDEIERTLRGHHRKLAEIAGERERFLSTALLVRAELLLVGIEGADAPVVERRAGRLTEACVEAIETSYGRGTILAIGGHTFSLTNPTADDAKNSASPAPSPSGPAISTVAKKPRTVRSGTSSVSDIPATLGSA